MTTIKLQKFLAHAGAASRRAAEEMIAGGRVVVNGQTAKIGDRVDPESDEVHLDGKLVVLQKEKKYFLVNKPVGLLSTTSDELGRKTVLDILPESVTNQFRLFPVGRLDQDSEGLMLITNDGELTQKLTHPKFGIRKTYHALLDRTPSRLATDHLRTGVKLKEGMTAPADVILLDKQGDNQWLEITIHEGRNRQVRRMLQRVGYEILQLVRVSMGPFDIEMLEGRRYLELTADEVEALLEN